MSRHFCLHLCKVGQYVYMFSSLLKAVQDQTQFTPLEFEKHQTSVESLLFHQIPGSAVRVSTLVKTSVDTAMVWLCRETIGFLCQVLSLFADRK